MIVKKIQFLVSSIFYYRSTACEFSILFTYIVYIIIRTWRTIAKVGRLLLRSVCFFSIRRIAYYNITVCPSSSLQKAIVYPYMYIRTTAAAPVRNIDFNINATIYFNIIRSVGHNTVDRIIFYYAKSESVIAQGAADFPLQ